jgi:hypothetical protein
VRAQVRRVDCRGCGRIDGIIARRFLDEFPKPVPGTRTGDRGSARREESAFACRER